MEEQTIFDRAIELATSDTDLGVALDASHARRGRAAIAALIGMALSLVLAVVIGLAFSQHLAGSHEWDSLVCGTWAGIVTLLVGMFIVARVVGVLERGDTPWLIQHATKIRALINPKSG